MDCLVQGNICGEPRCTAELLNLAEEKLTTEEGNNLFLVMDNEGKSV